MDNGFCNSHQDQAESTEQNLGVESIRRGIENTRIRNTGRVQRSYEPIEYQRHTERFALLVASDYHHGEDSVEHCVLVHVRKNVNFFLRPAWFNELAHASPFGAPTERALNHQCSLPSPAPQMNIKNLSRINKY